MAYTVRFAESDDDKQGCYSVRMRVFVEEQNVPVEEEMDAYDAGAKHFLVEDDGVIVGTARLLDKGDGIGKIGRVAVLPEHRGNGLGRAIMQYVMAVAFRRFHTLILDAQLQVIPFYEKLGFDVEGPVFLDAGIEHRRMVVR